MGSLPAGITIVTALDGGEPRGLTAQTFAGISLDPPLVLVSLERGGRTLDAVRRSGAFVVNILAADGEVLARRFATKSADKFAGVAWDPALAAGGAPILRDQTLAYAACCVERIIETGDHMIVVGRLLDGAVRSAHTPLLYWRRTYRGWPE